MTGVIETAPVNVVWVTGRWVLKSPVRSCVFAGIVFSVLSFVFSWFLSITIMGQAQVTPKTLFLNHFPEIRAKARDYGVEVKKVSLIPSALQSGLLSMWAAPPPRELSP